MDPPAAASSGPGSIIPFVSERPYVPAGTFRELLLRTGREDEFTDEQIVATLGELEIDSVAKRAGGLDREQDWASILSVTEQHLLTLARILLAKPRFAMFIRSAVAHDRSSARG